MCDSPWSLNDICVDYICHNLFAICKIRTSVDGQVCRVLSTNDGFYLPSNITEELVVALSDKGKIEDSTLMLFDSKITCLENVFLRNTSKLTINGLLTLQSHKILHLEVMGLTHATVSDLISCLGEWVLQNLQTLNVANSTFVDKEGYYDVSCVSKLRNLRKLNVRNTEFNEKGLETVVDNLPNLINLDISETLVCNITSLKKCKDRLESLTMYNLLCSRKDDVFDVICELHLLQHLDISNISCSGCKTSLSVGTLISDFLRSSSCPFLTSLDISGTEQISIEDLRYFLVQHPNMRFLGLARSDLCKDEMFIDLNHNLYNPDLVIAGCANEAQILEVLRRYPQRMVVCREAMSDLHTITECCVRQRLDIISLILHGMRTNPKELDIQFYAMRCLESFYERENFEEINLYWLNKLIELVITAMENFPSDLLLQEICLLFLRKDRVFKRLNFDKYQCLRHVMDTMCNFDDDSITETAVCICKIAAKVVSTEEKTSIGANPLYMNKILSVFRSKLEFGDAGYDYTLSNSLSAICNLSEASLETCRVFLVEDGLNVFVKLLEKFLGNLGIEERVMIVMLHIAEFKDFRVALMSQNILTFVRLLLKYRDTDTSFYAAGILAYLASDGECAWTVTSVSRAEMLKELGTAVMNWEAPETEINEYNTFERLYPLLLCYETKEVQLWAVWAMHYSCNINKKVSRCLLSDKSCVKLLQEMVSHPRVCKEVRDICRQIFDITKN